MSHRFYTIGHSTRSIEEFVGLLGCADVELVVDVRTVPRSRTNPQYGSMVLADSLSSYQIGYEHIPLLGGLRGKQGGEASPNTAWENKSFRNYADYARTVSFAEGLNRLITLGTDKRAAIMCAEAVWWRCHRRIIADYLIAAAHRVIHIMSETSMPDATITPFARVGMDGKLIYPAQAEGAGC